MKAIKILGFLWVMVIFVSAAAYAQTPAKEIILGCEMSFPSSPVWIAENRGYFKGEGINVILKKFGSICPDCVKILYPDLNINA